MRSLLGAARFQQEKIYGERQRRGEHSKHCPIRADRRELYREQGRRVYGRARNQAHRIPPARSEQAELSHRRRAYERTHKRGRKSGSRHRQTRKAARFRQTYSGRPRQDRRPRGSERKRHALGRGICRAHRRHSGQARARGYAEHGAAGQVRLLLHSGYGQKQDKPYGKVSKRGYSKTRKLRNLSRFPKNSKYRRVLPYPARCLSGLLPRYRTADSSRISSLRGIL